MNKRGFSEKDVWEWVKIIVAVILGIIIIKALLSAV